LSGTAKPAGGQSKTVAVAGLQAEVKIATGSGATALAGEGAANQGDGSGGGNSDGGSNSPSSGADPGAQSAPQAGADGAPSVFTPLATTAAPVAASTATPTTETVARLATQIVQTAQGAASQFSLTLHPEELGGVEVKIQVDRHGAVSASMTFDNPQAAADVKAHAAELKAALNQAGFDVSDDGLSFNSNGQGQQSAGDADAGAGAWAGRTFRNAAADAEDIVSSVNSAASRLQGASGASGLDIRI
jgi:flagellar hook-length control protein FliK